MYSQHERFVQELLNQMPQLSSEQYLKYRQELDQKLSAARRDEKTMRWIVLSALAGAVLVFAGAMWISFRFGQTSQAPLPDWFILTAATVVLLFPVAVLMLFGLYLFKYRRRVAGVRLKTQEAALGELQRQLNDLRSQLPPPKTENPPTHGQK